MSRKMIDYKVENGKIVSIDGYELGGGGSKAKKLEETKAVTEAITKTHSEER